jgi:hypothetical protein
MHVHQTHDMLPAYAVYDTHTNTHAYIYIQGSLEYRSGCKEWPPHSQTLSDSDGSLVVQQGLLYAAAAAAAAAAALVQWQQSKPLSFLHVCMSHARCEPTTELSTVLQLQ